MMTALVISGALTDSRAMPTLSPRAVAFAASACALLKTTPAASSDVKMLT